MPTPDALLYALICALQAGKSTYLKQASDCRCRSSGDAFVWFKQCQRGFGTEHVTHTFTDATAHM